MRLSAVTSRPEPMCNANVAFTAHSTAAAPPELRHATEVPPGRRRLCHATAASGVRLYEVAVPLADDPGKVRELLMYPCTVAL